MPTLARQTVAHLIETRRGLVFLDCGSGIARLHDPMFKEMLQRHQRALVLLSHWHQDHVQGLAALPFFLGHMEVTVAGPGPQITGEKAADVLARYGGAPLLSQPMPEWGGLFRGGFEIVDLRAGKQNVGGEKVEVIPQPHTHPSIGLRVRDVSYITDTVERDESIAFAKGSAVLLHDAWLDNEGHAAAGAEALAHSTATGAARIARAAEARQLVLTHLNPAYDVARLERMFLAAAAIHPATQLATDMASFSFTAADDAAPAAPPERVEIDAE
jgi:ribonuclease BN (tRNA processing enzyme)